MIAPGDFQSLTDEELMEYLEEIYETPGAARHVFNTLRGKIKPEHPLD